MTLPYLTFVEDSDEDFFSMKRAMRIMGLEWSWERLRSADHELQLLRARNASGEALPELIVLDLNLPGMSGIQFLETLRADEWFHDLNVVVMSTSANPNDVQACSGLGVLDYFNKPIDFDALCDVLGDLDELWSRH